MISPAAPAENGGLILGPSQLVEIKFLPSYQSLTVPDEAALFATPATVGAVMASDKQLQANRLNARKSTGPQSPEGKQRVAQNRIKHGLAGEHAVLASEDPSAFDNLLATLNGNWDPHSETEAFLVETLAFNQWRLLRIGRSARRALSDKVASALQHADGPGPQLSTAARALAPSFEIGRRTDNAHSQRAQPSSLVQSTRFQTTATSPSRACCSSWWRTARLCTTRARMTESSAAKQIRNDCLFNVWQIPALTHEH